MATQADGTQFGKRVDAFRRPDPLPAIDYAPTAANNPNTKTQSGGSVWGAAKMFDFSLALRMLKNGHKVARVGWNGKGMFLYFVEGSTFKVSRPPLLSIYEYGKEVRYRPHIDMRDATGQHVPWLASQTDLIAEDWVLVVD